MKSMIRAIYYGNGRSDKLEISDEYGRLTDDVLTVRERLESGLSKEQKDTILQLCDLYVEIEAESEYLAYNLGFKDGFLLAVEILAEQK